MIALSIVSHNQKDLVKVLLNDLCKLNTTVVTEVVLTHNASDDRHEFPNVIAGIQVTQIFNRVPKGFGANHNAAFKHCATPYFVVLNPDIRMPEDPFAQLISEFDLAKVGLIAPRVMSANGLVEDSARSLYTPFSSFSGLRKVSRLSANPAWFAGMFLLFKRESFASVQGFDEKFFMYVEDVDICARLVLSGWSLKYVSSAFVVHDARRANRKTLRHLTWHLQSALRWWASSTFWRYKSVLKSRR
jgi:N-acetylglucosaminyl-diphospho-decaprenol L-rhamnosyltransferase